MQERGNVVDDDLHNLLQIMNEKFSLIEWFYPPNSFLRF